MADVPIDDLYPEPDLGDLMGMRDRLNRHRAVWYGLVQQVRAFRFHEDQTPDRWSKELTLPPDHRFRTNLTGNEIQRVVALMNRNQPKVYVPPSGENPKAVSRSQKQSRWGQDLFPALERNSILPISDRVDDAAVESSLGVYEFFLTDTYDQYAELADEIAGMKDGADRRDKEAELRALGLPFALRSLDPTTVFWEPGNAKRSCTGVLIVEKKDYKQVFHELADGLSTEEWDDAKLPPIAALGMPTWDVWGRSFYTGDQTLGRYNFAPDDDGQVEVYRYYDERWLVEYVAGHKVRAVEHGLPGVPIFLQFGTLTSSSYLGYMLRGVTFGMIETEQALNDILTLWEDNQFKYGRPMPVVTTSEQGAPISGPDGRPVVVNLSDPTRPPQLGPGQTIVDAFNGFKGQIDPGFVNLLSSYFHMSGLNPIAQGETPTSDPSGFALNTQQAAATAMYAQLLKNKQRTMGEVVDFCRACVRDSFEFGVTVIAGGEEGHPIEYITLQPDEVDDVPARVTIDPLSDAQRLAVTQWLVAGNEQGYIQRRTVQRYGYGSVIDDPEAEDDGILEDHVKQALAPMLVQTVIQRVITAALPELQQQLQQGGADPATGDPASQQLGPSPFTPPAPPTIGAASAQASQTSGPSARAALAARGRGGQQPTNQGTPQIPPASA